MSWWCMWAEGRQGGIPWSSGNIPWGSGNEGTSLVCLSFESFENMFCIPCKTALKFAFWVPNSLHYFQVNYFCIFSVASRWMVQSYFVGILLLLLVCLCMEFFFVQGLSSCLKVFLSSSCEQCQQKETECEGYINFTMFASNVPKLWWYFEGYINFNCSHQKCTDCDAILCHQDAQATLLHWPWPTGGCESNILQQWTVTNTIQQSDPLRCAVGENGQGRKMPCPASSLAVFCEQVWWLFLEDEWTTNNILDYIIVCGFMIVMGINWSLMWEEHSFNSSIFVFNMFCQKPLNLSLQNRKFIKLKFSVSVTTGECLVFSFSFSQFYSRFLLGPNDYNRSAAIYLMHDADWGMGYQQCSRWKP